MTIRANNIALLNFIAHGLNTFPRVRTSEVKLLALSVIKIHYVVWIADPAIETRFRLSFADYCFKFETIPVSFLDVIISISRIVGPCFLVLTITAVRLIPR